MAGQPTFDPPLLLRALNSHDEPGARIAHEELRSDGFDFLLDALPDEPWSTYLDRVEAKRLGLQVRPGWVPATFLVAEVSGQLVGRVSIRHELNAALAEVGGHIGYGVRPGFRRRGHATEMLRQGLAVLRSLGVHDVLVTCDDDNIGSARTIEKVGGVWERTIPASGERAAKRRYWIPNTSG
jgi:predicted acetyltransferase